jgi:predicted Zn finger-like uncharacterized protein
MILVCPSCNTRYFAKSDSIGPQGRAVRCASCGHKWHVEPEMPGAALEVDELAGLEPPRTPEPVRAAAPATPSIRAHVQNQRGERARRTGWSLWGGIGALLVAGVVGSFFAREAVVRVWPKSASAYAVFGLRATDTGLQFAEVTADRLNQPSGPILSLKTTVENLTASDKLIPFVRVSVQDDNAREVGAWIVALDQAMLSPHQRVRVTASIPAPPKDARNIRLAFIDKPDLATPIVYGHSEKADAKAT